MLKVENPRNILVDFERYQKRFEKADCLLIEASVVTVITGNTVHMYNFNKVNSLDYDNPPSKNSRVVNSEKQN